MLVLSPSCPERHYPEYWSHNLAGMTDRVTLELGFVVDTDPEAWRLDGVLEELGPLADPHELFGHSAGGQLLHRLALFAPSERHGRILAANAGWYTVPTRKEGFPYGLRGTGLTERELRKAFASRLVVFLGEEDDADETRGSLRRTPGADHDFERMGEVAAELLYGGR